ncbi:MAG: iron complex outermembrane receptor protein [Halieaceae bacterium]|jgi:iron complex outermembrane receptor protein
MKLHRSKLARTISLVSGVSISVMASLAQAQIEEVIVTAQKRSQSVQEIPLAVTAMGADMLDERGITDIASMVSSVPGMHFGQSGSNTRITIRGIGTEQTTVTGDPGVAFHIDGVYQARSSAGNALFYDLARVEVLRGPQGTLYGRNATGGSVNLVTKAPDEELGGSLEAQIGNYNQRRLRGVFNTPLVEDKLFMRISGQTEARDGYYENITPGADDIQDVDSLDIRAQFLYLATDTLDARLSFNYATTEGAGYGAKAIGDYPGPPPFLINPKFATATPNPSDPRKVAYNDLADRDNSREGLTLTLNWDLGSVAFKSITAWQDNKVDIVRDLDFSNADIMNENSAQDSTQYSQEFQLSSTDSDALEWIAGLYWLSEETDANYWLNDQGDGLSAFFAKIDVGLPDPAYFGNTSTTNADSFGAFGQVSYHVSDNLKLTGGLRYSKDEKSSDVFRKEFTSPTAVDFTKEKDWDSVTWKLGADWFVSEDSMLYASVSTGFKSGGFLQSSGTDPYEPEEILAWEIGSKNRLYDDRLQANISAYFYEYTDMQLTTIRGQTAVTTNAGEADIQGIEVELVANPTDGLTLTGSLAYTDAEFTEYSDRDPQDRAAGVQDLSGNRLARTPEYTFNLSAAYTWDFDSGSLTSSITHYYSDEVFFTAYNRKDGDTQDSYHRTDARLAFTSADDTWHVALAAKNLEDDEIASQIQLPNAQLGGIGTVQWQAPLTYTLTFGYNFY